MSDECSLTYKEEEEKGNTDLIQIIYSIECLNRVYNSSFCVERDGAPLQSTVNYIRQKPRRKKSERRSVFIQSTLGHDGHNGNV